MAAAAWPGIRNASYTGRALKLEISTNGPILLRDINHRAVHCFPLGAEQMRSLIKAKDVKLNVSPSSLSDRAFHLSSIPCRSAAANPARLRARF